MRAAISSGALLLAALVTILLHACAAAPRDAEDEISRERAIEVARGHLEFEAQAVEAEKVTDEGRPVWRVTFRGEPIGPGHPMGEVLIVLVDRRTGEVVSLAMS